MESNEKPRQVSSPDGAKSDHIARGLMARGEPRPEIKPITVGPPIEPAARYPA